MSLYSARAENKKVIYVGMCIFHSVSIPFVHTQLNTKYPQINTIAALRIQLEVQCVVAVASTEQSSVRLFCSGLTMTCVTCATTQKAMSVNVRPVHTQQYHHLLHINKG